MSVFRDRDRIIQAIISEPARFVTFLEGYLGDEQTRSVERFLLPPPSLDERKSIFDELKSRAQRLGAEEAPGVIEQITLIERGVTLKSIEQIAASLSAVQAAPGEGEVKGIAL